MINGGFSFIRRKETLRSASNHTLNVWQLNSKCLVAVKGNLKVTKKMISSQGLVVKSPTLLVLGTVILPQYELLSSLLVDPSLSLQLFILFNCDYFFSPVTLHSQVLKACFLLLRMKKPESVSFS